FAAIICAVESRALENQTRARAKQTFYLPVSPLWQLAKLLRTFAKRFIAHRLECFESLPALLTRIFVGWHEQSSWAPGFQERRWEVCIKQITIQPGLIPELTEIGPTACSCGSST